MTPAQAQRAIAVLRALVGVGALAAPHQTGRLFGMDMAANVGAPFFARLYGARQLAMAAPILSGRAGAERRDLIDSGMRVDLADTASALVAGVKGYLPPRAALTAGALSTACVVLGRLASGDEAAAGSADLA